jgi:hypothetical protein
MELLSYRIANALCRQIHFSFTPCHTSDARMIMGYVVILVAIAAVITAFFYSTNRPTGL